MALESEREPRVCPGCGLVNPGSAETCDCGYGFDGGRTLRPGEGVATEVHAPGRLPIVCILAMGNIAVVTGMTRVWPSAASMSEPHVLVAFLTVALALGSLAALAWVAAAESVQGAKRVFGVAAALQVGELAAAVGTLLSWPGGDDGPGLLWLVFAGLLGPVAIGTVVTWMWTLYTWPDRRSR